MAVVGTFALWMPLREGNYWAISCKVECDNGDFLEVIEQAEDVLDKKVTKNMLLNLMKDATRRGKLRNEYHLIQLPTGCS